MTKNIKQQTLGLGDKPYTVDWTIGTEATNAITVTAQFKDYLDDNLSGNHKAKAVLWDATDAGVNSRTIEAAADVGGGAEITMVTKYASTNTYFLEAPIATAGLISKDILVIDGKVELTIKNKVGADYYILSIYFDGIEYQSDLITFAA